MYKESYTKGVLLPSLRLAIITLILKPKKPPNECSSFRPISLMECAIKILCKALARRLELYLLCLVGNDQNDLVKNRHGFHNICRILIYIIYILLEKHDFKDTAALSLDQCQAFDRIEWGFLFNVLPRFGIGVNFWRRMRLLYTSPASALPDDISPTSTCQETKNNQLLPILQIFSEM